MSSRTIVVRHGAMLHRLSGHEIPRSIGQVFEIAIAKQCRHANVCCKGDDVANRSTTRATVPEVRRSFMDTRVQMLRFLTAGESHGQALGVDRSDSSDVPLDRKSTVVHGYSMLIGRLMREHVDRRLRV